MKWIYAFNEMKTELLEYEIRFLSLTKTAANCVVQFEAAIREIQIQRSLLSDERIVIQEEKINQSFQFPLDETSVKIDIKRIRKKKDNKWMFYLKNNTNAAQYYVLGILDTTFDQNPILLDVLHSDSADLSIEVLSSSISMIEDNEVDYKIAKTIVEADFSTLEVSNQLILENPMYQSNFKLMQVTGFSATFDRTIPANYPFQIKMNVAPNRLDPTTSEIWKLTINSIGTFEFHKDVLRFVTPGRYQMCFLTDNFFNGTQFFNNGFLPASRLEIIGDGNGMMMVKYLGKEQTTIDYFADRVIDGIAFEGSMIDQNQNVFLIDNLSVQVLI